MRSLFIVAIVAILISSYVYAAPVGNPTEPAFLKGNNNGKLSGIVSILFERELENGAEVDELVEYASKLSYNIDKKAEVYAILGVATESELNDDNSFISGSTTDVDAKSGFLYGGGVTVVIYETTYKGNPLRFGADGKIQACGSTFDNVQVNDIQRIFESDEYDSLEWQIALGLSYEIEKFVPYAGVKYSDVRIEKEASIGGVGYSNTLNADNLFGMFVGCDFLCSDNIKLNIEGRFFDETALSVGGTIMY